MFTMRQVDQDLWNASFYGDVAAISKALAAGAHIDCVNENGTTPLCIAAQKGHKSIVETLLIAGANVNHARHTGATPTFVAAQNGHAVVIEKMLEAGANADLARNDGATPLYIAAMNGHESIVDKLLVAGAQFDVAMNNGVTPLSTAAYNGRIAIVKKLLDIGASVDSVDVDGDSVLICAALRGHVDVACILIEAGADASFRNRRGMTAAEIFEQNGNTAAATLIHDHKPSTTTFLRAIERGNLHLVRRLVKDPGFVSARGDHARTPLHLAAKDGNTEMVKILLANGAKLAARDDNGWTPLHAACTTGNIELVHILLEAEANPSAVDDQGLSCLDISASHGRLDAVKMIAGRGVSLTNTAIDGRTLLHHSVFGGNASVVKYVLDQKCLDVNAADMRGWSALHFVMPSGVNLRELAKVGDAMKQWSHSCSKTEASDRLAIIRLLLAVDGVNVNAQNLKGESALLLASEHGGVETLRLLLDHGARTDLEDNDGRVPLSVAASSDVQCVLQLYHNSQQYHDRCFSLVSNRDTTPSREQIIELVPLITSVHDLPLLFTLGSLSTEPQCLRTVLRSALDHVIANNLTFDDDACVYFKLILERCEREDLISREDFLLFDRKAEKANTGSADWVVEMKKRVYTNSWRLDTHQQHLQFVVDGVKQVHTLVMENRAIIGATASRVEKLQSQTVACRKLLNQLVTHANRSSAQMTLFQRRLEQTDENVKHVAMHFTKFRDAYTNRLEQEAKNKRKKMICGVMASIAGFILGPVLKQISNAVVDFANPIEIVSTIYGERDIAGFLAEQSDKLLPDVIRSQLEKYAIPQDTFETLLREEIALLHPEIVSDCEKRGLEVQLDGGRSDIANSVLVPPIETQEAAVTELLRELKTALCIGSLKYDGFEAAENHTRPPVQNRMYQCRIEAVMSPPRTTQQDESTVVSLVPEVGRARSPNGTNEQDTDATPILESMNSDDKVEFVNLVNGSSSMYHEAVERSQGDLCAFKAVIGTLSTGDEVAKPAVVHLRSTRKSREKLCAAEYAYARGYDAVGDYLVSLMAHSRKLETARAVSVILAEPADAFAYVYVVDESHGDVDECAELCELMDKDHVLDATIEVDVERVVETSFIWTPVEYACHLGYVEIVKYMLKELCKKMTPRQKIEMLKRARERAAVGAAA